MEIKKVLAANGRLTIGFDEFDQLMLVRYKADGSGYVATPCLDARGKKCIICGRTWTSDPEDMAQYMMLDNDNDRLVHPACYLGHSNLVERSVIRSMMDYARKQIKGRIPYELATIPNEYWPNTEEYLADRTDWYWIGLPESEPSAAIKFGSRKRVWVLELVAKDHGNPFVVPSGLFEKEDVTKEIGPCRILIHAWDKDAVNRYATELLRLVTVESE